LAEAEAAAEEEETTLGSVMGSLESPWQVERTEAQAALSAFWAVLQEASALVQVSLHWVS